MAMKYNDIFLDTGQYEPPGQITFTVMSRILLTKQLRL